MSNEIKSVCEKRNFEIIFKTHSKAIINFIYYSTTSTYSDPKRKGNNQTEIREVLYCQKWDKY